MRPIQGSGGGAKPPNRPTATTMAAKRPQTAASTKPAAKPASPASRPDGGASVGGAAAKSTAGAAAAKGVGSGSGNAGGAATPQQAKGPLKPLGTVNMRTQKANITQEAQDAMKRIFPTPDVAKSQPEFEKALGGEGFKLGLTGQLPFGVTVDVGADRVFGGMDRNGDKQVTGQELLDGQKANGQ